PSAFAHQLLARRAPHALGVDQHAVEIEYHRLDHRSGPRQRLDRARATGPVGFAQPALEDLARVLTGQRAAELHHARRLVAGEVGADVTAHRGGAQPRAVVEFDVSGEDLAQLVVRDPEHGAVAHARQGQQAGLDLGRVDVDGAADHDVGAAVVEVQIPVGVEGADVAAPDESAALDRAA